MKTLKDWLDHCEQLHHTAIDMGLARITQVKERLGLRFDVPVITVAGTNGKGSTCAMLDAILSAAGYKVGVTTSPHLVHFEERCRLAGRISTSEELLPHFEAVEQARGEVSLSFFEFTTLAILRCLSKSGMDVVILEVGLGGRLDAMNIIDTDCAVITSIDIDHSEFLGHDRETIGREKAGIMRAGKPCVVSDPVPPASLQAHADTLGADLWLLGRDHHFAGDRQQWGWTGRAKRFSGLAYPALRGANQLLNASGVLAALEALREQLPISAQAVRQGLALVEWPGRFQIVPGQPTVVLDVAHNPHATATLVQNLDQMGFYPATHAVFGAMKDKDITGMIQRLLPLVETWHLCDLPTPRAAKAAELAERLVALKPDVKVVSHPDPHAALLQAMESADPADRILVFGSFYTVGGVLERGVPRGTAPHLQASPGA